MHVVVDSGVPLSIVTRYLIPPYLFPVYSWVIPRVIFRFSSVYIQLKWLNLVLLPWTCLIVIPYNLRLLYVKVR